MFNYGEWVRIRALYASNHPLLTQPMQIDIIVEVDGDISYRFPKVNIDDIVFEYELELCKQLSTYTSAFFEIVERTYQEIQEREYEAFAKKASTAARKCHELFVEIFKCEPDNYDSHYAYAEDVKLEFCDNLFGNAFSIVRVCPICGEEYKPFHNSRDLEQLVEYIKRPSEHECSIQDTNKQDVLVLLKRLFELVREDMEN